MERTGRAAAAESALLKASGDAPEFLQASHEPGHPVARAALLGILLMIGAVALGVRTARRTT